MSTSQLRHELISSDFNEINPDELEVLRNKSILITGCTGLIGSLLIRLIAYANDRYELSARAIGVCRNPKKANAQMPELSNRKDVLFIPCDLTKDPIPNSGRVDFIVHAAAITASRLMVEKPVDVIMTSVLGTQSALNFALSNNAKLVYLSSMEVYGIMENSTIADENTLGYINPLIIRSCYPESKRLCENLCISYAAQYKLEICIARLAATTGIGIPDNDTRALTQFVKTALYGNDIALETDGKSELNCVYTTDAIRALMAILQSGITCEAYNIANPNMHMSVIELAQRVALIVANNEVSVLTETSSDISKYAPETHLTMDVQKIEALGWTPKVDTDAALLRIADWVSSEPSN